mmetsp:Transcript_15686/g.54465  ORF Transcript_15686/g.54465 Transcript_15686/m.54465 type:complete len:110 (-) Transcript_15686:156-485(-)
MADVVARMTTNPDNKIVVFSKTTCGYCRKAKAELAKFGTPVVLELDRVKNGGAIQDALAKQTGQRTVPSVWINGKFLGGCDDTMAASRSGSLAKMLSGEARRGGAGGAL